MSTEEKLKELILKEHKSIRNFCIQNNFPYSTVDSIFKRGIMGSSVSLIIDICDKLNIDVEELANGKIIERIQSLYPAITQREKRLIAAYRNKPEMQVSVDKLLDIADDNTETARIFRAAKSDDNAPGGIIDIPKKRLQKIKDAPEVDEI